MKKKNKIIVGCLSALALVSLTTVGFATWLVGVTQTSQGLTANLQVDNVVKNEILFVEAKLAENTIISVAEDEVVDREGTKIVGTKSNGSDEGAIPVSADALKFSLASLTVRVGKNVSAQPTAVKIVLDNSEGKSACNTTSVDTFEEANRQGISWTYLAFEQTLNLSDTTLFDKTGEEDPSSTYITYTLKEDKKTFTLGWGTYFELSDENKKPTDFYNSFTTSIKDFTKLLEMSEQAHSELLQMYSALNAEGAKIDLTVSIVNGD